MATKTKAVLEAENKALMDRLEALEAAAASKPQASVSERDFGPVSADGKSGGFLCARKQWKQGVAKPIRHRHQFASEGRACRV